MSENSVRIDATPRQVWDVLADGWLFPLWVVGASRMRDVDPQWPMQDSRIYHSVGVWPRLIDDHTTVLAVETERRLLLAARAWPLGEAEVEITLSPQEQGTRVVLREDVVSGPGALAPAPARQPGLWWRNRETLRRLRMLVEGRARYAGEGGQL